MSRLISNAERSRNAAYGLRFLFLSPSSTSTLYFNSGLSLAPLMPGERHTLWIEGRIKYKSRDSKYRVPPLETVHQSTHALRL